MRQFYIVAPLMLAAVWRFPKALPAFAIVTFCLSLAAMLVLSFGLAVATYFAVERPIRRARERRGKPLGWRPAWGGATVCAVICLGGYLLLTAHAQAVASQLVGTMLPASPGNAGVCDLRVNQSLDRCKAQFERRPIGVLIGDSQAAAATRALVDYTSQHDVGLTAVASGGCISLLTAEMRIPDASMAERCGRYRDNARRLLATVEPEFAILYSYWNLYAGGVRRGRYYFIDKNGEKTSDQRARFISEFSDTIQYLKSLGIRRILVIGPTPSFPKKAPECIVRATRYGQNPDHRCSKPKEAHDAAREAAMEWLGTATAKHDGVRMIDPSEVFCDASFCRPYGDGYVLFNDTNHISDAGVRAIIEKFTPAFDWVTAGR